MFDLYLDGLIFRTNDHNKLLNAKEFFSKPIINGLSDISYPCQILSDLFTLRQHFKTFNLKILWMGDMNNVCFSLLEAANLIEDISLIICTPSSISIKKDWVMNSNISIVNNLDNVELQNVKCVMTDVFVSMNDQDSEEKIRIQTFQVTAELMSKTLQDSIFMHCLPAKVGLEVSKDVFHSSKSIVWKQAYNRMIAQKKVTSIYLSIISLIMLDCSKFKLMTKSFFLLFFFMMVDVMPKSLLLVLMCQTLNQPLLMLCKNN